jgi:hypothetical protein
MEWLDFSQPSIDCPEAIGNNDILEKSYKDIRDKCALWGM